MVPVVFQTFYLTFCKADTTPKRYLCPGLHAAAKFAIFRLLAKNRKNCKVGDWILRVAPAVFHSFSCTFSKTDTALKRTSKVGPCLSVLLLSDFL